MVSVMVNPYPDKPSILENEGQLTSSATNGNQWYSNDQILLGETSQSYTAKETGEYHVIVTNEFNCSISSDTISFTIVGLEELERLGIKIYPNPSNKLLIIESDLIGEAEVRIFDLNGRILFSDRIMLDRQNEINAKINSVGQYVFQINHNHKVYKTIILIEH